MIDDSHHHLLSMIETDDFLQTISEEMDLLLLLSRVLCLLREVHFTRGSETILLPLFQPDLLLTIEDSTKEIEERLYVYLPIISPHS